MHLPSVCSAALLACALAAPLAALETPLVVTYGGNSFGSINAGSGQVAVYDINTNGTDRKSQPANFLTDLQMLEARAVTVGGQTYSLLRTGWVPGKDAMPSPTPEEIIQSFRKEATADQRKDNDKALSDREQVRKAENDFWSQRLTYDGVVRGAFNGQRLMVVVPSHRTALFYQIENQAPRLIMAYNYSPALYIQLGRNTTPSPQDIISQLKVSRTQVDELLNQVKKTDEKAGIQAAKSDVWCCATGNQFCLVDIANQRIMTFEDKGKAMALRSVRNIGADLLIPSEWQATPDIAKEALALGKSKELAPLLAEWGIKTFDQYTLKALVAMAQAGQKSGKDSGLQASHTSGQVILDFTSQRKLATYMVNGAGNGIQLTSVRDYSFDIAVDLLYTRARARAEAADNFKVLESMAAKGQAEAVLARLKSELRLVPALVDTARKSSAFKKFSGKDKEELDALLTQADQDKEAFQTLVKTAVESAAAERERAKKDGK
jgi:hypothetical protein